MKWILRSWVYNYICGWTSDFESYRTKKEAVEAMETYKRIYADAIENKKRTYEIYRVKAEV